MYPILKVADFKFDNRFRKFGPESQLWAFRAKMYQIFNLNKILSLHYVKVADFKSDICFRNFEPKSPNLDILLQKILTL